MERRGRAHLKAGVVNEGPQADSMVTARRCENPSFTQRRRGISEMCPDVRAPWV